MPPNPLPLRPSTVASPSMRIKIAQVLPNGKPMPGGASYTLPANGWPAAGATISAVFRAGTGAVPANGLCGRTFLATVQ